MSRPELDILGTGTQMRIVLEIIRDELVDRSPVSRARRTARRSLHKVVELDDFDSGMVVPRCSTIVCHGNPLVKQRVHEALAELEVPIAVAAVHHRAVLSSSAHVGAGAIVNALVYLGECAELGTGAVVHSGAIVEHDCVIGNYAVIAPGVTLCGGVTVGECASVYAGATVLPNVTIGDGARIAAGAVVLGDVPAGYLALGVPARLLPPAPS